MLLQRNMDLVTFFWIRRQIFFFLRRKAVVPNTLKVINHKQLFCSFPVYLFSFPFLTKDFFPLKMWILNRYYLFLNSFFSRHEKKVLMIFLILTFFFPPGTPLSNFYLINVLDLTSFPAFLILLCHSMTYHST